MKSLKLIDAWTSTVLICIFTLAYLFNQDFKFVLIGYFVVGAWQVFSMAVHAWNHWFTPKGSARIYYHWFIAACLFCTPILAEALLFMAPFLAVYYTWICYEEVYVKMKRPLSVLK